MLTKVNNIYLCDSEGIKEIEKLTGEKYNNLKYGGIVFEGDDGRFYNYCSTDVMFPFTELK